MVIQNIFVVGCDKLKKDRKLIIYDVVLLILALYIALLLSLEFSISKEYMSFFKLTVIPVIVITLLSNKVFHLYDSIWKYASMEELISIIYSLSLSNLAIIIYSYVINYLWLGTKYYRFPYAAHIIFWILSVVFLGGTRFMYRVIEERNGIKNTDKNTKKLLIIGAGDAAAILIKEIKRNPNFNYEIVGLVDDDDSKQGKLIGGAKVLGKRENIVDLCKENKVEEIIFSIPSIDINTKRELINVCKNTGAKLKTLPGIYEIIDGKVNMNKVRDVNIDDLLGREEVRLSSADIDKYIKDKIILVTGGGGSIGSELCRQIAKFNPKNLLILDIYENNAYDLQMELNYKYPSLSKEVIISSIRDENKMRILFEKYRPDVVFHAAAHKHVPLMENNPAEAVKNNIIGTYNIVKCSHEFGVKKFVQISTDKAVNPTNIMGATKRFCEIMIQAFDTISDTEYVAVRFGNVLGSNGSVIPLFKKQISHGGPVTVTHPEINRFFMTIPEAAQLVIQAGGMAKGGEIFVLDMGEPVKIVDLAKDLIKLSGYQPDVDIKIQYTGLRPGEKLYEEPLMDEIALTSTTHDKIYVEKPTKNTIEFVENSIEQFRNVVYNNGDENKEEVFKLVQEKVPTYNRKNNLNR